MSLNERSQLAQANHISSLPQMILGNQFKAELLFDRSSRLSQSLMKGLIAYLVDPAIM